MTHTTKATHHRYTVTYTDGGQPARYTLMATEQDAFEWARLTAADGGGEVSLYRGARLLASL